MKRTLLILALTAYILTVAKSQDCSSVYFPQNENAQLEYRQFDRSDKLLGSAIQTISEIRNTTNGIEATVDIQSIDAGGKSLGESQIIAKCEKGIYYLDMSNYFNRESMEAFEDMEMTIKGGGLELPSNLKAGDDLKGGEMTLSIASGGMTIMNMAITISNRKVEAVENLTTPAGTFECYKISFMVTTKMMGTMQTKGVEWYTKDIGMVKSESYGNDGKLAGYTLLTNLKK